MYLIKVYAFCPLNKGKINFNLYEKVPNHKTSTVLGMFCQISKTNGFISLWFCTRQRQKPKRFFAEFISHILC